MEGYSISQVAERTGFTASALRFYEQAGLIEPARTAGGYRSYDDADLARISFIGRAKRFGLSLDEITELLTLRAGDECAPVQDRLRDLLDAKIADARRRVAELRSFTVELERVAASLTAHTPDGPCDDSCGCTDDRRAEPVALGTRPAGDQVPIACTLSADARAERLDHWRSIAAGAVERATVPDGVRLRFDGATDTRALATLIAAEHECCRFLTFSLRVGAGGATLDITAPDDARELVDALVGAP